MRLLWIGLLLAANAARADDITVTLDTTAVTNEVARGFLLSAAGVGLTATAAWQANPSTMLRAYTWTYYDASEADRDVEVDVDLAVLKTRGLATWTAGYHLHDSFLAIAGSTTQEAYAGVSFGVPGAPYLFGYYDFDTFPGFYWEAGASHAWAVAPRVTGSVSGALGFETARLNGFRAGRAQLEFRWDLGAGCSLAPGVTCWFPSSRLDPGADGFRGVGTVSFVYHRSF